MSCVRFKFKSSLDYDTVTFNGLQLSVGDLRKKIMAMKKLGSTDEFTLQIMDAQSKKLYSDESEMVSRNTSVIIMRVPVATHKVSKAQFRENIIKENGSITESLKKTGNLAEAEATEEEKVLAMMSQAGEEYNPANYARFKPRGASSGYNSALFKQPPPPNYVCHRCGQKGHWIKFCPTNGDPNFDNPRIKPPSGIPKSQLMPVTTDIQGAMKDRQGNLVIRKKDMFVLNDAKKSSFESVDTSVPPELTCSICNDIFKDAVIIPCCGESFCDACIREYLLENEFKCYACEEMDVSPDRLVPNKRLRNDAKKFQSVLIQKKRLAVTRGLPNAAVARQQPPLATALTNTESLTVPSATLTNSGTTTPPNDVQATSNSINSRPQSPQSDISKIDDDDKYHATPPPRTPPPPKSPITISTSSPVVQITKPITVSMATSVRPIISTPPLQMSSLGMMATPIVTHPMAMPMVQQYPTPHGSLLSTLPVPLSVPGMGHVLQPVVPPTHTSASALLAAATLSKQGSLDPTQIAKLTELLAAADSGAKRSPSPAPLSFEEFQRQQKVLRGIGINHSHSRSRTRSDSYISSRSPTPRSPSPHRDSRSRSPIRTKHSHSSDRHSKRKRKKKSSHSNSDKSSKSSSSRKSRKHKHHSKQDESVKEKSKKHKKKRKHARTSSVGEQETLVECQDGSEGQHVEKKMKKSDNE